jgi:hypothetical protein
LYGNTNVCVQFFERQRCACKRNNGYLHEQEILSALREPQSTVVLISRAHSSMLLLTRIRIDAATPTTASLHTTFTASMLRVGSPGALPWWRNCASSSRIVRSYSLHAPALARANIRGYQSRHSMACVGRSFSPCLLVRPRLGSLLSLIAVHLQHCARTVHHVRVHRCPLRISRTGSAWNK